MSHAEVWLWGTHVGSVMLDEGDVAATFQYTPDLRRMGVELSPLQMPLRDAPYRFVNLPQDTFHTLPGLLADSLPDRFGNAVINAWLRGQGRQPESFDAVERLCYTGARGMGALEFRPSRGPSPSGSGADLDVAALVRLASEALAGKESLDSHLDGADRTDAITDIMAVGTSAGGARAKAVIAYHPGSGRVRSGQVDAGDGFEHWLLKFDGVDASGDYGLQDPKGWGRVEYAYHLMALEAGIEMRPCQLLEEGGRSHFMTRRFDRPDGGGKLHMQSLGGLAHLNYRDPAAHSYEEAFGVIAQLGLGADASAEQFRRMVFNVIARNQDDHVKNVAFLMDRDGDWSLSPAFDLTYANDRSNRWMARHQMSVNGKRDDFTVADLRAAGRAARLRRGQDDDIIARVTDAVRRWPEFADTAGVEPDRRDVYRSEHRTSLPAGE